MPMVPQDHGECLKMGCSSQIDDLSLANPHWVIDVSSGK